MVINTPQGEQTGPDDPPERPSRPVSCRSDADREDAAEEAPPTAVIRYGYLRHVGEFSFPSSSAKPGRGDSVVIQTSRGIEIGEVVSPAHPDRDSPAWHDQITSYVEASGSDYCTFRAGRILRPASPGDEAEWKRIKSESVRRRALCQELADKHRLPMKVVECEHLLGGERIIFYFVAEGRVDFRLLVRELAGEFQTRIEMRQVGARDEARLLADYETCGRECCCQSFLKSLKPISMKMAKMQKATLDPAKVSGRCGRLKCCLRYEHASYEELDAKLPPHGARVASAAGIVGTVVARQILAQLLQVQTADGGRCVVPVEDLIDEAELARRQAQRAHPAKEKPAPLRQEQAQARGAPEGPKGPGAGRKKMAKSADGQQQPSQPKEGEGKASEKQESANKSAGAGRSKRRRGGRSSSRRRGGRKAKGKDKPSPPNP